MLVLFDAGSICYVSIVNSGNRAKRESDMMTRRRPLLLSGYLGLNRLLPGLWHGLAKQIHRHQAAERGRLPERLGHSSRPRPEGRVVWVHAESVGEVNGIANLLHDISEYSHIMMTTTTQSGADQVERLGSDRILHQFKPADTPIAVRRFLDHWRPCAALFAESDMPPVALALLRQRGIARALIAARPSRTRRKAPKIAAALLAEFDLITAVSQDVATEIETMGATVTVVENLKSWQRVQAKPLSWPSAQMDRPIWLAVSVHPEDIGIVLDAHRIILSAKPDALLVIAPRHPRSNRGWAPAEFGPVYFSDGAVPTFDAGLFVMDAFGHLPSLHRISHVSFIGGGFGTRGGHSPWEAAHAGSVILTGPDRSNNAPAYAQVPHQVIDGPDALAQAVLAGWSRTRPDPVQPVVPQGLTAAAVRDLIEGAA